MGIPGPNFRDLGHPAWLGELAKGNRRSFAYHPRAEIRSGILSLRMTRSILRENEFSLGRAGGSAIPCLQKKETWGTLGLWEDWEKQNLTHPTEHKSLRGGPAMVRLTLP